MPSPKPRNLHDLPARGRSRVSNGSSLFLAADPKTREARRFRDLLASIVGDLGGADHVSTGQMQLARRCALLSTECEKLEQQCVKGDAFDLETYGRLTDRLGRALERIGLNRHQRDITPPSLEAYLEHSHEDAVAETEISTP